MEFNTSFSAKILLFGEYTIIHGGSALAMPYNTYYGKWEKSEDVSDLMEFFNFLSSISGVNKEAIEQAKTEHWIFNSSIPLGYGLGSSGALTAAAYDSFFSREELPLKTLQAKLAEIESYFHGKSSGLDPLASYLKKPIRVQKNKVALIEKLALPPQLYLFDSQKARVSKPLIQHYKIMMDADKAFKETMTALSNFNNRIIAELIEGENIRASFKEISLLQYEAFDKMIPTSVKKLWKKGLDEDSYYFKLSGAGGGGFFLVLTNGDGLELENVSPLL